MKVWTLSSCSSHPPSHICSATIHSNVVISPDKRPLASCCGHSVFTIRLEKKLSYLQNVVSLHDGSFWNFIFHDLKSPRKRNGDLLRSDWLRGLWEIVLTVGRCRRTQTIVGGIISWFVASVRIAMGWLQSSLLEAGEHPFVFTLDSRASISCFIMGTNESRATSFNPF